MKLPSRSHCPGGRQEKAGKFPRVNPGRSALTSFRLSSDQRLEVRWISQSVIRSFH